jgi:hypothetical protein
MTKAHAWSDFDNDASWASPQAEEPWPEMASEAFYGLAGQIVDTIAPSTESDPVAILAHTLVEVGNAHGRKSHAVVEDTFHFPNLYVLLIGATSRGRKGTARAAST